MGYVPPQEPPPPLNVDRYGLPRDFATYMWLLYRRRVVDDSPARIAFLHGPKISVDSPYGDSIVMTVPLFHNARLILDG